MLVIGHVRNSAPALFFSLGAALVIAGNELAGKRDRLLKIAYIALGVAAIAWALVDIVVFHSPVRARRHCLRRLDPLFLGSQHVRPLARVESVLLAAFGSRSPADMFFRGISLAATDGACCRYHCAERGGHHINICRSAPLALADSSARHQPPGYVDLCHRLHMLDVVRVRYGRARIHLGRVLVWRLLIACGRRVPDLVRPYALRGNIVVCCARSKSKTRNPPPRSNRA